MNVIKQLLRPKFESCPPQVREKWNATQTALIDAFLRKRGLHRDEVENFDSFLPLILQLVEDHVKISYVDSKQQWHRISVSHVRTYMPFEDGFGFDNPERAVLRNQYEAAVYGKVTYTIHRKPILAEAHTTEPVPETPVSVSRAKKRRKRKHHKKVAHENDSEQELDQEEDEDDEEEVDEEEEEEDEPDDEDEDEDRGMEEEDEEEDDEDEEEEDDEEGKEEGKNPALPVPPPSATTATPVETDRPEFFIERETKSEYSEEMYRCEETCLILYLPVWLGSRTCITSTPMAPPSVWQTPLYRMGCTFIVARNLKLIPYEEYYVNNRPLSNRLGVEMRSKFYHRSKRARTNCTLKFSIESAIMRKNKRWHKPPRFVLEIPHETPKQYLSVTVLAMAYGWTSAQFVEAVRMFLRYETDPDVEMFLGVVARDVEGCTSQRSALLKVAERLNKCRTMTDEDSIVSYVSFTLRGEWLPNLIDLKRENNFAWENRRKGFALAEAVAELIQLSDLRNQRRAPEDQWKVDDKRSYTFKRIDTPGEKLMVLTRKLAKDMVRKASGKLKKAIENSGNVDLSTIINPNLIDLCGKVKSGVWDVKNDAKEANQNKTQMLSTGYCSDSQHTQTQKIVRYAMPKNSKPGPLLTHPSQCGRIDMYRTPENERCAIVRNKAMGAWITRWVDLTSLQALVESILERHAADYGWVPLSAADCTQLCCREGVVVKDLFGGVIGWVKDAFQLYRTFLRYRRSGQIYEMLGMEWDRKRDVFFFNADEGRITRPLVILDQLDRLVRLVDSPTFKYQADPVGWLLMEGCVEYLDASEEYCGFVFTAESLEAAERKRFRYTHMEVHQIFSLCLTVCRQFCNHNQGPRMMGNAGMVSSTIAQKPRPDPGTTKSYTKWYAHEKLMGDPASRALGTRRQEPDSENVLVAVISQGRNIEDSLILSRQAVDLGLGRSSELKISTSALGHGCEFGRPDHTVKGRAPPHKYHALQDDGTARVGAVLSMGDAITGRVFKPKLRGNPAPRCVSVFGPWNAWYRVQETRCYPPRLPGACSEANGKGGHAFKVVQTVMCRHQRPQVGDKFKFDHCQKGTISAIERVEDMPFICSGPMEGVSPTVVINVAALKRVTLGLQLDALMGMARAVNPTLMEQYNTVFMSRATFQEKLQIAHDLLTGEGLSHDGRVPMRLGTTGELMECEIFVGLLPLCTLTHLSQNKLRSRDRGPVNELTRQPSVGKKKFGGQKQGEMENWNMMSYGMTSMFQAINYESADKFELFVCSKTGCGKPAVGNKQTHVYVCPQCKTGEHVVRLPNTYITQLFLSETQAAGLEHTFVCEPVPKEEVYDDYDHYRENHQTRTDKI